MVAVNKIPITLYLSRPRAGNFRKPPQLLLSIILDVILRSVERLALTRALGAGAWCGN